MHLDPRQPGVFSERFGAASQPAQTPSAFRGVLEGLEEEFGGPKQGFQGSLQRAFTGSFPDGLWV